MTEPVAEVVELVQKLRARADIIVAAHEVKGRKIERPFCLEDLAADLIERLSRERDTGVPEGFWLAPNEPTREMEHAYIKAYDAICAVSDQYDDPFKWFEAGYNAVRAAAPQPPTVSDYEDRQKFEQHLWRVIDDGNPPSVPSDLVDAVARIKSYANRVTRERDQAREALAKIIDRSENGELGTSKVRDMANIARSVLHPDTEVSS